MKLNSSVQLGCVLVSSSSLAAVFIGLSGTSASAQITIQSTGTLSGTIQLPRNNPNFNQRITRVDTDDTGTYSRNLGTNNNPNYVPIYKSDYVQVQTRSDGSLHYFVDFKGIPIVSFNGVLTSPILSGGELTPYKYQGQLAGTTFQGVVQDEFNLTKALYTGIVTDPNTGNQYQGTFEVSGYGVRYSDRNGSATPTVFDFKSDLPGSPKVTSLEMTNAPLAKIQIKVPATATLITPTPTTGNGSTTTPPPVSSGGSTPTPPPVISGGSTSIPPSVIDGSAIAPAPVVSGDSTPTLATIVDGGNTFTVTPIVDGGNTFTVTPIVDSGASSTPTTYTSGSNSPSISTTPNMELSNGNFLEVNQVVVNPATLAQAACSQDSAKSCTITSPKQAIGPRSRVLLR
ncbi:hypothetical protein CDG76_04195 [Nostoc sp. 'Peltigera membranacea cyanobiont' 210A]|uniref:hypothetical protein n=1 Tax=Nostoc sp. 'Peltigera membranacea cyanobiont' 210A TaxID=2014529 RepID=UPI000B9533E0|nr:hypothetical protein [Nostoc sp. 'Peltigera membranacea cyanobiont' 210A]OYD98026.1 hypothetical protein CDG76_04195 [Nostoc sp. 'Peltigera membranacea cyanobiont' 210A]